MGVAVAEFGVVTGPSLFIGMTMIGGFREADASDPPAPTIDAALQAIRDLAIEMMPPDRRYLIPTTVSMVVSIDRDHFEAIHQKFVTEK